MVHDPIKKILITLIALVNITLVHSQTFPSPGNFTLPAGKSIVITYEVDVNPNTCPEGPLPVVNLSNQATVTGSNFPNVLTDDPDIIGTSNPTLTPFAGHSIGNLVFNDMNRNGIFDMGDLGIDGVVMNLYRDLNGNNMLDAMDGTPIATTSTTMMPLGAYTFAVCPGTYIVEVAGSNFLSGGALYNGGAPFVSSPMGVAPDPDLNNTDGDDNGALVSGFGVASTAFLVSTDKNDVDFSFKTPTMVTINDVTMNEGTGGSTTSFNFMVERSDNVEAFSLTVNTANGTATTADLDYTAVSGGTVMFSAGGNLMEMVTVSVNHDNKVEAPETFNVLLSSPPAGVTITDGTGLGTITNDDNATVTLTGQVSQSEGTNFTFTATLDNPVQGGFMVSFITSNGTATVTDNDYTDNDGSLTFAGTAGEMETITVLTIDDQKVEQDENFTVELGAVSGAPVGVAVGGTSQTGTILNNDQAMVTITDVSANEGDMGMTAFNFTVTLDKEVDATVGLNYTTVDGTATIADLDYVGSSGMITPFTANGGTNQTRTITVQVNGDSEFESDEEFIVRLSALSASGRDVIFSPAGSTLDGTGTIVNDDLPPVVINEVDSDTEGSDMLEFVELYDGGVGNTPLDGLVLVFFNGADDQSYRSMDLDGFSTDVNGYFIAGNSGVPGVDLTFPNETLQNGADAVAIYVGDATDFPTGSAVTTTGLIDALVYDTDDSDDPALLVLLNVGQPQVNEDVNSLSSCQSMQRLPNGSGGPRNTSSYVVMPPTPKSANQLPVVTIAVTPSTVVEDGMTNLVFTISRTGNTGCSLPVNFSVEGSASSGTDYAAIAASPVIIPAGASFIDIMVDPMGDNTVEPDETVMINILAGSSYSVGTSSSATGTIENDDQATVTLAHSGSNSQNEGDAGSATFSYTVTLDNPVQGGFRIDFATMDGNATTADGDYNNESGFLDFNGTIGEQKTIMVDFNGDTKVESDEDFSLSISNISMLSVDQADVSISGSPLNSTISNDDQATLTIANVAENEGDLGLNTFTFEVTLSDPVQGGFQLNFGVSDGTATNADDYDINTASPLTFSGTANEVQTISLDISGDEKVEDHEFFTIILNSLSALSVEAADITFSGSPATGTITNDDSAMLTLSGGAAAAEGNTGTNNRTITATLDKPVQDGFTISYMTSDVTANTMDNDYEANSGTFTFVGTANESQMVDLVVNGDLKVENDESFALNLGSVAGTSMVQALAITVDNQEIIAITNDEIDFGDAPDSYGTLIASNGARHGTGLFGFQLGALIDGDLDGQPTANGDGDDNDAEGNDDDGVSIPGLVLNQMATIVVNASMAGKLDAWIDYDQSGVFDMTEKIADNLALTAGNNNLNIVVPPGAMEGTTFARFRLSSGGGLSPTGIAPNGEVEDYQVTISNVLFSIDDPMVAEGNDGTSNLVFTVSRNNNGSDASVDYEISGGTATAADNDYQPLLSGTLNFTSGGALQETITVLINGDNKVESNETVIMTLSNPVAAGIEDEEGTGTITNDDQATLAISNPVIIEGDGGTTNAVFDITLSNPADFSISFNYSTQDGTATIADNDYQTAIQQNGGLLAGAQLFSVMIPVNGDCAIEPDEMFSLVLSDIVAGDNIMIPTTMGQATIQNDDALPVINCPANVTQTVACNTTSKVITLPVPATTSVCGSGTLVFRYRTVNAMNTPTGVYTAYVPSGSNTLSFSLGRYEIEWRITDGSGMSSCSYYLQVNEMMISTPVIQGPTVICPALNNIPYQVVPQPGVTDYQWSYSGTGVTIHNNGSAEISLDFAAGATAGTLTVTVINPCGGANAIANINIELGSSVTCALVNCLVSDLFVSDMTLNLPEMPQIFKVSDDISSNATIQAPKTILFKAGESINLLPGFKVNNGAIFVATIEDCPIIIPFITGH